MVLIRILFLLSTLQLSLALLHEQKYTVPPLNDDDVWPELEDILLRPELDMRVVGGNATTIQNIGGFLVSLYYEGEFVCGGTLIEERIVITAAHCFLGRTNKKQWTVKGGVTKRFEPGPIVEIDDYVSSAAFNSTKMHMDVAIISLARPLKDGNIGYATLCSQKLTEGLELTIYGWGLTDSNAANPTQTVRTVTVPVIKKSRCREVYKVACEYSTGGVGSNGVCVIFN